MFILVSVLLSILFACLFFFLSVCLSMSLSAVQSCSCNLLSCLDGLSIWPAYQLIINTGVRGWRAGGEGVRWMNWGEEEKTGTKILSILLQEYFIKWKKRNRIS